MNFAGALMSNKLMKGLDARRGHASAIHYGRLRLRIPDRTADEARTYGHGGGAPGMNAILRVYPESGQSVIVLCNLESPSASRMGDWLHARMPLK